MLGVGGAFGAHLRPGPTQVKTLGYNLYRFALWTYVVGTTRDLNGRGTVLGVAAELCEEPCE
jgi:hypothetical protein